MHNKQKSISKFFDVFKILHVNAPCAYAIVKMPSCAKFIIETLTNKRWLEDFKLINVSKDCNTIVQTKISTKLKDLGHLTILCIVGTNHLDKALCDLWASINLMPFFCILGDETWRAQTYIYLPSLSKLIGEAP